MEKTKGSDIPKEESMDKANSETTRKVIIDFLVTKTRRFTFEINT